MPKTSSTRKRKMDDGNSRNISPVASDTSKHGNLSPSLMPSIRRPTPQSIGQQPPHVVHSHLPTSPPTLTSSGGVGTSSGGNGATTAGIEAKYKTNAVGLLDLEANATESKVAGDDSMADYYRMESRKLDIEELKLVSKRLKLESEMLQSFPLFF